MKVWQLLGGAFAFLGIAFGAGAATLAESHMDTGTDGWQAVNGARDFQWNPDGYVEASDTNGSDLWFFAAPTAFRGDISAAYGGTLSFSLMSTASLEPLAVDLDVQIVADNGVLLAYAGGILPGLQWTNHVVPIVAGAWHVGSLAGPAASAADMLAVLSNVKQLRIRGDYYLAVESTALDDVVLATAPVPEPATATLTLAGLAVFGAFARRRRAVFTPGNARAV